MNVRFISQIENFKRMIKCRLKLSNLELGEVGKSGSATFEFIGGTGKYKSISGSGTVTRITIQAAKKGFSQSKNIFKGSYKLN